MGELGQRIHIVGTTGSGKTTLAGNLARELGLHHIELDALQFRPNWVEAPREEFRAALKVELQRDSWVADGNYGGKGRDLIWALADTIIWLDLPKTTVMRRVLGRTWRRWWTQEELWAGNRERLRTTLFTRDSILYWAWTTHGSRREEYSQLLADVPQTVIQLRTGPAVDRWLAETIPTR